jgi:hypothetical protein
MATNLFDSSRQILAHAQVPLAGLIPCFERAAAEGCRSFNLTIAGHPVRVRVAGSAWADIVAASMGHLRRTDADFQVPALTIDVWDAGETGVDPPQLAEIDLTAPPILMKTSDDGRFVGEERHHGMTWLDREGDRIVGFTLAASRLNLDERARPFHKMLSAWLEDRGVQFVHSGLITHGGKGILFVGNGGAGKSTSSISCLRAGMGYLGDDFIGLGLEDGRFVGHGLYASCLLNVHHIKRFPDLQPIAHAPNYAHEEKFVLYLTEAFPGCLRQRIGVDALVLPRVVDSEVTTFRAATKAATLMAIAPTSVMLLPRPNRAAFERLTRLVETTPSFWLELGRRVDLIPAAVQGLAESLPRNAP